MNKASVLIVCSDSRAAELKGVLEPTFQVFLRQNEVNDIGETEWKNYLPVGAREGEHPATSKRCEILFFHAGGIDPKGIPDNLATKAEFAFSGPGLGRHDVPAGRTRTIPIQRRFEAGDCPVRVRHVQELQEYLLKQRTEPPSFCRHEDSLPILRAIAIVCQAYAAALIAAGSSEALKSFGKLPDLFEIAEPSLKRAAEPLGPFLREMHTATWWQSKLGFWSTAAKGVDESALLRVLKRLALDLEVDVILCAKLEIHHLDQINDATELRNAFRRIAMPACGAVVLDFLHAAKPWESAGQVYSAIEGFLKER